MATNSSRCKDCTNKEQRERYANDPNSKEKVKLKSRKFRLNHPELVKASNDASIKRNKEKIKKRNKEYYRKNIIKRKAKGLVRKAIIKGEMKRGDCIICGKKNAHANHENYSKPLDVIWLCSLHHIRFHKGMIKL